MKTTITSNLLKLVTGFLVATFAFSPLKAADIADCGYTCSDVKMTINCEGELIVDFPATYGKEFSFYATSATTGMVMEVDNFKIGDPIFHAVTRFQTGGDFILDIDDHITPCFQTLQGTLPSWDVSAGSGSGLYVFSGTSCFPSGPTARPTADGPGLEVVQVLKPTCSMGPQSMDGSITLKLNGDVMPAKCAGSTFSITLNGITKMATIDELVTFENLPAGTYQAVVTVDTYTCPCDITVPGPESITVKSPSSNTTSFSCIQDINISANENCLATIDFEDIYLSQNDPCDMVSIVDDTIYVYDLLGNFLGSGSNVLGTNATVTFDAHAYIGSKLKVEIRDGQSDNWCWGYINIEDKLPPVITCNSPGLTEILCLEFDDDPSVALSAHMHDCDDDVKITTISEKTINDCDMVDDKYIKMIEMTYFATDKWGNKSNVCTDTVRILRFDTVTTNFPILDVPGTLIYPPDYVKTPGLGDKLPLICSDNSIVKDQNGNPAPIPMDQGGTGWPQLQYKNAAGNTVTIPLRPINYDTNDPAYIKEIDGMLSYCKIAVTYDDFKYAFGCITKIQRTWTIREWSCQGEQILVLPLQEIQIMDNEGPEFTETIADADVTVNSYNCSKYKEVKIPTAIDACDGQPFSDIQVTIFDANWNLIGPDATTFEATHSFDFPMGLNYIVYTAFDKCHNFTRDTAMVNVQDLTPPVVVCKEFLVVGISADGTVRVPKHAFDNGSYDDCQMGTTCVVRMDDQESFDALDTNEDGWVLLSDFTAACGRDFSGYAQNTTIDGMEGLWLHRSDICTPEIHFCCTDDDPQIDNDEVQVIFRAQDFYSNENECMVVVEIQDKSTPTLICPPDVAVDCEVPLPGIQDLPGDFINQNDDPLASLFGKIAAQHQQEAFGFHKDHLVDDFGNELVDGVYFDNCNENLEVFVKTETNFDQCGTGIIKRTFYVQDASGNRSKECMQTITINQIQPLNYGLINWPDDILDMVGCLNPNDTKALDTGEPTLPEASCTLIGMNSFDEVYPFNTNDSQADQACFKLFRTWKIIDWCKKDATGKPLVHEHTQIIKITDIEGPELVNPDSPDDNTWGNGGICAGPSQAFDATSCDAGAVILSNDATDLCTDDDELVWTVKVKLYVGTSKEEIHEPVNRANGPGALFTIEEVYPVGDHQVLWTIEDLCGNAATCIQDFTVLYDKKPTPFANELSTVLMNTTHSVEIWADDLNNKSGHACYDEQELVFTIARTGEGIENSAPYVRFDCDDVGPVSIDFFVRVIGTDLYDYTTLVVNIQDNLLVCDAVNNGQSAVIAGNISTSRTQGVMDMGIGLATQFQGASTMLNEVMTNRNGDYAFPDMPMGGNYDIRPTSTKDYLNGVTTLDLVQIQQFVLGLKDMVSPYDQIAADVNNDEKISAVDIVNLRSLILGMETEFTNNTSWRFVDAAYQFTDGIDPLKSVYPEFYRIDKLEENMNIDFVGVKIGDVNGSVELENVLAGGRSRQAFTAMDREFKAGEKVNLTMSLDRNKDLLGFQFTMSFDGQELSFDGVQSDHINVRNENIGNNQVHKGYVTMSWHTPTAVSVVKDQTILEFSFTALKDGKLSNSVEINSTVTAAEVYDNNYEIANLGLEFIKGDESVSSFELKQNRPNPFSNQTEIGFYLPEASSVRLTFYDVTGKEIYEVRNAFSAGEHSVMVNKDDLPANGVIYYTMETDKFTKTKRAVILK